MNIIDIHHVATSNGPWKLEKIQGPSCNSPLWRFSYEPPRAGSARIPLGRPLRFSNLTRGCAPSSNPARFNPLIRPAIFLFICRRNLGPRVSFPRVFDPGEEYTLTFYLFFFFFFQTHPWPPYSNRSIQPFHRETFKRWNGLILNGCICGDFVASNFW